MDFANRTALQRLPPKKARSTGEKMNRHSTSFHRKVRLANAAVGTSRERRLTHRPGSTVALEYPSQGQPVRGQNEAYLEDLLGVSKAGARRLKGIPMEGGVEPLGSC